MSDWASLKVRNFYNSVLVITAIAFAIFPDGKLAMKLLKLISIINMEIIIPVLSFDSYFGI